MNSNEPLWSYWTILDFFNNWEPSYKMCLQKDKAIHLRSVITDCGGLWIMYLQEQWLKQAMTIIVAMKHDKFIYGGIMAKRRM